jgi:thiamine biosynthesis lipoprotein
MRPLLGTYVEIGFQPVPGAEHAVSDAFAAIGDIERKLSFHDPRSELSRLNGSRGEFQLLSPIALQVLRLARAMTAASGGLFNCTLGGLLVRRGVLPNHDQRDSLDCGSAADLQIEHRGARLVRDVKITLDGIAKGYAVDRAVRLLRRARIPAGWVNAGGDLRVFGNLTLPVQRREANGTIRPLGGLQEAAMASSAVRGHPRARTPGVILGGTDQRPAPGVWSVLAHQAWRADALTKVAALAPAESRHLMVSRLGGRLLDPVPVRTI